MSNTTNDGSVKVGRVGIVKAASSTIFRSKSFQAAKFTTVGKDTPLAITRTEDGWYGVIMANGQIGWIDVRDVEMTAYELVSKPSQMPVQQQPSSRVGASREDLVRTALNYTGIRYSFGGTNPSTGMDCSAFVRMVFSQYSVSLPRTAREQAQVGTTVSFDQLQPGDRLYFSCKNPYVDHCGIYCGVYEGKPYFVHCNATKNGVSVDRLDSSFYSRNLVVAKRS